MAIPFAIETDGLRITLHFLSKSQEESNTFLHYICMNDDNYPLMEIIKPTNKEINKQNNLGQTSLHIAIINKNEKIIKYLIHNGANVNISDNNLNMSLHLAVLNNDIEIIKLLIENKANPLLINKNKETVLDIAIKRDYKECINLLKEVSLMNESKKENNKKILNLKNQFNLNEDKNKNNINGKEINKNINLNNLNINNNIFSHKIIRYKKKINDIFSTPKKNNINIKTYDKNKNQCKNISLTSNRNNVFFTSKKAKPRQRTNSTTTINFPLNEKIYTKKIINRSQSTSNANIIENNIPRKTDFIMQNEVFLDSDNESIEEEESIIREKDIIKKEETIPCLINKENKIEKIIESFTSMKTIKVTPLTETNNKINPFQQIDSFVSAIHKNDQGISESDGYIKEDGVIIVEPSIDITNNNINKDNINNKKKEEKEKINKNNIKDTKKDLYDFLKKIEMEGYNELLIKEGFDDINLVINQMKNGNPINDDILKEIGINRPGDRAKILIRIQECAKLFEFKIPFEAVYYINRKKYELLKFDFHVKALQNWLKKLNLQNYLENFYNNGYYSPELIFIQKASKFPINETILERDLKIENINDRKLIMASITSNSKNYISELKKKQEKRNYENGFYEKEKEVDDNKCNIY
mgnify:CR=1 FL=1